MWRGRVCGSTSNLGAELIEIKGCPGDRACQLLLLLSGSLALISQANPRPVQASVQASSELVKTRLTPRSGPGRLARHRGSGLIRAEPAIDGLNSSRTLCRRWRIGGTRRWRLVNWVTYPLESHLLRVGEVDRSTSSGRPLPMSSTSLLGSTSAAQRSGFFPAGAAARGTGSDSSTDVPGWYARASKDPSGLATTETSHASRCPLLRRGSGPKRSRSLDVTTCIEINQCVGCTR